MKSLSFLRLFFIAFSYVYPYYFNMESAVLEINITSTYFLGIVGVAISTAWYFSARLSKIETRTDSIENTLREIKTDITILRENSDNLKDLIIKNK